jgi:ankyrin repeat protein
MPTRPLPNDPSLEHLRKEAKRLRNGVRARDGGALAQVNAFHPRGDQALAAFALADAQFVTARSYGFDTWTQLKLHLAEIGPIIWNPPPPPDPGSLPDVFIRLACLTYTDWHRSNPAKARRMLDDHPGLATANLFTAAAVGDIAAVRRMIDEDPGLVNAKGGVLRWEPLLYACYSRLDGVAGDRSSLEVARLLLSRGADPNAGFLFSGSYAFTALTGAFGRGEDWDNQPPHSEADALATVLLEAGADPNDPQTLYNRHFHEHDDHLKLLFAYGLGQDKSGPWLKRLRGEHSSPETMLVQQLCWAATHNFPERVKLLLDNGVDVNTPGVRSGRTPYEEALRAGHDAIAEYLLQRGARKVGLDQLETFARACITGRRAEARARLAADPALLERLGHQGRVDMLHRAADAKHHEGIRLIVELGVDINGMVPGTGLDRTVLHNAAGWAGVDMVKLLLDLGADPNLRDPTYQATPIGWALHNQQRDVVDYLLPSASIFDAVQSGGVERVAALLEEDASLANARDDGGYPVVCYLHPDMTRLTEMIQLLLAHGADFNAQIRDGKTPVDGALARGWIDFANVLREVGGRTAVDVSHRETDGA